MTKYEAKYQGSQAQLDELDGLHRPGRELTEYDGTRPAANGLDIDNGWPQPVKHIFLSLILQNGGKYWDGADVAFDGTKHNFNFTNAAATRSLTEMVRWVAKKKVMFPDDLVPATNTFVTVRLASGASGYGWNDPAKPLSVMGYAGTWALANTVGQLSAGNSTRVRLRRPAAHGGQRAQVRAELGLRLRRAEDQQEPQGRLGPRQGHGPLARGHAQVGRHRRARCPALKVNGTPAAAAADPQLAKVQPLFEKGQWVGYIPAGGLETIEGILVSNFFDAVKGPAPGEDDHPGAHRHADRGQRRAGQAPLAGSERSEGTPASTSFTRRYAADQYSDAGKQARSRLPCARRRARAVMTSRRRVMPSRSACCSLIRATWPPTASTPSGRC